MGPRTVTADIQVPDKYAVARFPKYMSEELMKPQQQIRLCNESIPRHGKKKEGQMFQRLVKSTDINKENIIQRWSCPRLFEHLILLSD